MSTFYPDQLAEPTRLWDLDQRNKRFVRDDIVMSARWLASVEELNTLAEVIGVPYRVKHTREDMKANGFVVDRSKYFKGIEDPWKGNMVEAYKAAGITYIDMCNHSENHAVPNSFNLQILHFLWVLRLVLHLMFVVMMTYVTVSLSSKLWYLYVCYFRDYTSTCPLPPGNLGLPLIGETLPFLLRGRGFFDDRRIESGNVFKTHLLGKPTIRVIGASNARKIIMSENTLVESQWPKSIQLLLGDGSLTSSGGKVHAIRKKAIMRAFTNEALTGYSLIIQETVQKHIRQWCLDGFIYGYKEFRSLAFELSCRVLLGFEMDKSEKEYLLSSFETFMSNLFSLPVCIPGLGLFRGMKARKTMLKKLEENIHRKLAEGPVLGFTDALSLIMGVEGREKLDVEEAKDVSLELLFAGHETTSSAASTLILQLSRNPHVLAKIRHELEENGLGSASTDLSIAKINKLKYVHHVVKETLRLSPPIGGGYRRALKTFEVEGYQIPKDWSIIYSIRDSHETCDVIDEPLQFRPERWDEPDMPNVFHYFPFGGGKKGCVGKEFAMLMLKIFAIEMSRSCTWNVRNKKPKMNYMPVPHPTDDLPMDINMVLS
ncbi:hypothetical protein FSP39_019197 [Pinctada imbricata]|uniref:Cytochrome P450 n=1 Tax=Pinctada imbricata TaxID=66713 RepID=A0AA89BV90_PINIB|nr:hypothetical protein FSP39_019197 [Pinctada imbricata]